MNDGVGVVNSGRVIRGLEQARLEQLDDDVHGRWPPVVLRIENSATAFDRGFVTARRGLTVKKRRKSAE